MERTDVNLIDIEKERIIDFNGSEYIPEKFNKCLIPQNDTAKEIMSMTLKIILFKMKYHLRRIRTYQNEELYLVSKIWYRKFQEYSKMNTMKRIIKSYGSYEHRPIHFTPNQSLNPGKIFFEDLFIRNKIGKDSRNILISKYNDCFDTKLRYKQHYKLLTKEVFQLLNNYFQCESNYIIKVNRKQYQDYFHILYFYIDFSVHLNIVFIPTLSKIREINEKEIEKFIKKHKIVYDVYFKQNDDKTAVVKELINIFKEKPYILSDLGVELKLEDDDIINKVNNFIFYKKEYGNNLNEILDKIFNEEIIKSVKGENKIKIPLIRLDQDFNLNDLFNLNYPKERNNIDYAANGVLFLEFTNVIQKKKKKNSGALFTSELLKFFI